MVAVLKTGGKQYTVQEGDLLKIEKIPGEAGSSHKFDDVLFVGDDEQTLIGQPVLEGAQVEAEIVEHGRHKKIIIFKKRRRKDSKTFKGHRQHYTYVKITKIKAS